MIGNRLGVGRPDADVDQGDALVVVAHEVIGWHLRQMDRRLTACRLSGQSGGSA